MFSKTYAITPQIYCLGIKGSYLAAVYTRVRRCRVHLVRYIPGSGAVGSISCGIYAGPEL